MPRKEPLYPHTIPSQTQCTTQVFAQTLRAALNRDEFERATAVRLEITKEGTLILTPLDKTRMPFGVGSVIKAIKT
jgi:hypothetical protein